MQGPAAPGAQGLLLSARGNAKRVQAVFESLPPVEPSALQGFWRGEEFFSGHPFDGLLTALGWAGKRFDADGRVDPLVFGRGGETFAVHPWLPGKAVRLVLAWPSVMKSVAVTRVSGLLLPLLRTASARAHVERVVRDGFETAAIVYEDAAIVDVLRKVADGMVLGRMEMRGMGRPYFFMLRR
jgi:hypothetical protein